MKMRFAFRAAALAAGLAAVVAAGALAVEPSERLADPVQEARARAISQHLRCLVCQNQSIDDSQAELARDLRLLVRERIRAGATDGEVIDFVVARYGNFVLLKPPFGPATYALWLAPAAVLLLAGLVAIRFVRRRRAGAGVEGLGASLTPEERRRLASLFDRDEAP